jgi:tetratricopeptide (TPR) repeat protein
VHRQLCHERAAGRTNSHLALQLAPESAQVHASRGLALSHSKRYEEAEKAFVQAVELDPKLYDAYYFHGGDAFVQGKLEKAARLFEQAAAIRPDDYQALALLAQAKERAIDCLERSVSRAWRRRTGHARHGSRSAARRPAVQGAAARDLRMPTQPAK